MMKFGVGTLYKNFAEFEFRGNNPLCAHPIPQTIGVGLLRWKISVGCLVIV